jgi:thiol-disulfide isomerase/thioredoxin
MKKIVVAIVLLFCFVANAQNQSIQFENGTWQQIKDKATAEKKLIFIDCYTTWCGPCKWMETTTFTNDTVADYFNQHFVCTKFDMEKGEGLTLRTQYNIHRYPNLLFIDAQGKLMHRAASAYDVTSLMALAKDAETPDKTYSSMLSKYSSGNRNVDFIMNYLRVTRSAGLNTDDIVTDYFATQKENDLSNRNNWKVIENYVTNTNAPAFKYLVTHKALYAQKYTSDSVERKIEDVFYEARWSVVYDTTDKTNKKYTDLLAQVKSSGIKNTDKLLTKIKLEFYVSKHDYVNYATMCEHYVNTYLIKDDAENTNLICYYFTQVVKDKAMLTKAVTWSKASNELDKDNPYYLETYANLLFLTGKKQEAVQVEEKVLQLTKAGAPKAEGMQVEEIEKNIALWKK